MSDAKLIAHARRLHDLAASRTGTRTDLVALRDLVPQLLERFGALLPDAAETGTASDKVKTQVAPVIPIRQAR
jgi:hypothetical protein